ncbi:ferrochelatase [Lapillicoccus sp.]|uniref:ferrochelatase n=1 Tax=Lapillicoccus sp. TaxID=1909287 RepID=UPI0032659092
MSASATAGVDGADKADAMAPYDGLLLVSFGGPEAPDEVMPFLRRVTAGRNIPDERLETVAEHYQHFGGRSPINDQNRELMDALETDLKARDLDLPVLWGNRNSEPYLADALRSAIERGLHRLVVVTTSAYSCYSSCRQYRENLADALAEVQLEGLLIEIDKIGPYAGRSAFVRANTRLVVDALRGRSDVADDELAVLFVTHSIPDAMDETSGPGDGEGRLYQEQHHAVADAITQATHATLGRSFSSEVAYCSRSGSPAQPWLGPDVNDRIRELAAQGCRLVVVAPIGFVSDHMEVAYDLDTEAVETAAEVGVELLRVATVGVDEEFVAGLVDLVLERAAEARGEQVERGPLARPSVCPPGCCPNLREARPALCGSD